MDIQSSIQGAQLVRHPLTAVSIRLHRSQDLVTTTRRFVREGPMLIMHGGGKEYQDNYIFLFNDLFLITRQKSGGLFTKEGEFTTYPRTLLDASRLAVTRRYNFNAFSQDSS